MLNPISRPRIQFGGDNNERWRIHWLNTVLGLTLVASSALAMSLHDHNKSLYSGWSLLGLVVVGFGTLVVIVTLILARSHHRIWPVIVAMVIGWLEAAALYSLLSIDAISLKAIAAGALTFMVIGGCLLGIAFTKWWWP